jgi:hypothetical protein
MTLVQSSTKRVADTKLGIKRTEVCRVWVIVVLEFVLERRRFYSLVVNATRLAKNPVFLS